MSQLDIGLEGLYQQALLYADAVRVSTRIKVLQEMLTAAITECDDIEQMRVYIHRTLHKALDDKLKPTEQEGR